jgi:hypothetical protein
MTIVAPSPLLALAQTMLKAPERVWSVYELAGAANLPMDVVADAIAIAQQWMYIFIFFVFCIISYQMA